MSDLRTYEVWEGGKRTTTTVVIKAENSFHARVLYAAKKGLPSAGDCASRWVSDGASTARIQGGP